MTSIKSKQTPWIKSKAKILLKNDIVEGKVNIFMDAKVVFTMHPEYADYNFLNFKTNLRNLHKSIQQNQERASLDYVALCHDLELEARQAASKEAPHYWSGSEASKLLKKDIDDGVHLTLKPSELWLTKPAYQTFPLQKFRDHIYQETRRRTANAYWKVRKERNL